MEIMLQIFRGTALLPLLLSIPLKYIPTNLTKFLNETVLHFVQ